MKIKQYHHILACLLLAVAAPPLFAEEITECDLLAGHPSDPNHLGPGVLAGELVVQKAIPACRDAVAADPESGRAHYQLSRSLIYWADANGGDLSEAMEQLQIAADQEYVQALFVLGLRYRSEGKICEAEIVSRKAADQGLKSAQISYVNDVLAGQYSGCELSSDKAKMKSYLEASAVQVGTYYENKPGSYYERMLLSVLNRELEAWQP